MDIPYSEHNIQTFYTFDQGKAGISQDFEVKIKPLIIYPLFEIDKFEEKESR